MKRATCFLIFSFITIISFSQTRRIAHRSHSGSDATYFTAVAGNFGLPPADWKAKKDSSANAAKDSIKKKNPVKDSSRILKTDTVSTLPSAFHREDPIDDSIQVLLYAAIYLAKL